ncbi:MAG TPA: amino acid adenylation domain-containing protein, partial [Thermoanaerobaculia bacterium]|nr:amino acid adenylation domain-containing protein [Thermoanaerobaculia bacterium]
KKAEVVSAAVIPPRGAVSGPFPLSFSQERLWLLDQLEPGSPAYNIPIALRLAGDLDVRALWGSYAALVRRHESLRTRFAVWDGNPVQVIDPPGLPPLPLVDLGGLPAELHETEARERAEAESLRPFDLQNGPLCRCVLFRLAGGDHLLLANLHHIVSDGWSTGIFARELGAFYTASRSDRPAALPPLPIQYADFALWQRKELSGATLEKHLTFWRQRLAGLEPVLELPSDRPRPAQRSPQGASFPLALPEPLSRDLKELALRQGTTLFTTLLAALFALLYRQTDQEDLCVGTPVAGRRQVETEGLIGFFVNTLVVSAGLAGAPSFRDHLARVHEAVLDAQGHEALPFEKLVSELAPERSLSHNPVFQVAFTFQNAPGQALELPGVAVRGVDLPLRTAKFDLTLALGEGSGRIAGGLDYSLDLFDAPTIARTAGQLQALLTAVAANPEVPLSEIPLLAPPERHQLLVEWNDTSRPYLPGVCLHELIQAERMPDAVAASFEDQALSYRELDRRANRLAHRLIGLGIKPDDRVGVRLERSLEMIIALLGVLKAGAAYVPLEPTYPAERLALLVASSGIEVVLDRRLPDTEPDTAPAVHVEQDHLAYVIYTSGSTGTPKGAMVPHRGIVNRLLWMQEAYPLAPGDRVLQKTPFSFDVSLGELFGPLLAGARLVFARPEGHKDPAYLAELIAREGITSLHFVPSMLGAFLEVGADLSSVRRVLASGEALPLELVRRFFEKVPGVELLNLYGPTEASVEVSVWACDPERLAVPIGRPISNLRLHVVNRELRPQPAGIPGELLLGGVGLARGYLGRPDLTAAAFVPDPFAEGGRLYRTGDLCRLLPDGNVEFLGRIDHQVKVRGFRIELGEIETVLGQHPGVARAVVVVLEERLVAYLVLRAGDAPRGVSTLEGVDAVETPRGASP